MKLLFLPQVTHWAPMFVLQDTSCSVVQGAGMVPRYVKGPFIFTDTTLVGKYVNRKIHSKLKNVLL